MPDTKPNAADNAADRVFAAPTFRRRELILLGLAPLHRVEIDPRRCRIELSHRTTPCALLAQRIPSLVAALQFALHHKDMLLQPLARIRAVRPDLALFPRAIIEAILLTEGPIGSAERVAHELGLSSRFQLARMLRRERLPALPEQVARRVLQIVEHPSPALRYRVGAQATWLPRLRTVVPWKVYAAGVRKTFAV